MTSSSVENSTILVNGIPKIIWTFWDSKTIPQTVKNCIKTWKFFNPDYKIIMINKVNYKQYTNISISKLKRANDSPARFSDFVRLCILAEHGGVWIDASIICIMSIEQWINKTIGKKKTVEFIGYYLDLFTSDMRYPVIESWCFACVKDSPFVTKWRDEFMEINVYRNVRTYIEHIEDDLHVNLQNLWKEDDPEYLTIHVSAQKILQKDRYPKRKLILLKAEDGPLKYKVYKKGRLSVEKRVDRLCKNYKVWSVVPFIKFTGEDREILEKNKKLRKCVFDNFKIQAMTMLTGIE